MSELVVSGAPVVSAVIEAHREGAWTADLVIDTETAPSGVVDVTDVSGTVLLRGRVLRAEAPFGRAEVRLVGGVGALATVLPPRYYRGATVRTILADLARETGSTLADDLGAEASRELAAWVRVGGDDAVTALRHLLRAALPAGWTWRARFDGSLWLGADSWPDVIAPEVEVVDRRPARGELAVRAATVAELLAIEPGMVFEGLDVCSVRIDASGDRLRAVLRTTAQAQARTAGDVVTSGIQRLAREATIERALLALYPAIVRTQDSDTAAVDVDLQPDEDEADRVLPSLVAIPLVGPCAGAKVLFPATAIRARTVRVLVGFEGGDPSRPYALPWALGAVMPDRVEVNAATTIALGGDAKGVARLDDSVGCGTLTGVAPPGMAGGPVTFVFTPSGGGAAQSGQSVSITGKITSASPKVKTS